MLDPDDIHEAANIAGKVYDDGLHPAVQEIGKTLALLPQAVNAALAPLQIWIVNKEYNVEETKKLLEQKLSRVGIDKKIVTPEAYVAVPAMQAISYSMNSEELRELYANLLARSMVDTEKDKVHPAFVEIIKQMTPDEAKLIKFITATGMKDFPLIEINRVINNQGAYLIDIRNFTSIAEGVCSNSSYTDIAGYLDNLCRLKIVEIPQGIRIAEDYIYEPLTNNTFIINLMNEKLPEGQHREIVKRKFEITAFGQAFIDVCVKDL